MNNTRIRYLVPVLGSAAFIAVAAYFFHGSPGDVFMSHAHCYFFNQRLMLLHGGSDFLIGISYMAISGMLFGLVFRARRELPFHTMMLAFAIFIVACGLTHFMEVWTLRAENPHYWLSGWVKLLTAAASLITAFLLPPLIPKALALLQSARVSFDRKKQLEDANHELQSTRDALRMQLDSQSQDLAQLTKELAFYARDLENTKNAAESANRAKDHFLAILSHELRTPLAPALIAATHLENFHDLPRSELVESVGLIRRNIELEARLVDDLLDLTRISKGKMPLNFSIVDVHETLKHAAKMCESEAHGKRSILTFTLEARDYHVRGDSSRLLQIFWNLILNAVKFTPGGGHITIRTVNPKPGILKVDVTDSGIGIDPELLPRIFEPFEQGEASTSRQYGGLGLGLSLAKGLVDAHDGHITASSEGHDRGATLSVEIKTTEPDAAPSDGVSSKSLPAKDKPLRILLVEDHEDTRHAMERLLKRWGHTVHCAESVAKALEVDSTHPFDILLSDLGLPDGTGIELLMKLRERHPLRSVAMSGYGMETDLARTREAGFDEHLIKPVAMERLREVIQRLGNP